MKSLVSSLRILRNWHRWLGIALVLFLLTSAVTGVLLTWKKDFHSLQPKGPSGSSQTLVEALPLDRIASIASEHSKGQYGPIERFDVRPKKGLAKVRFEKEHYEIQIDLANGAILTEGKRRADLIEKIHDGSIVSDLFKKISMNFLGIGTVVLGLSGFWLWFGPRRIRKIRRKRE